MAQISKLETVDGVSEIGSFFVGNDFQVVKQRWLSGNVCVSRFFPGDMRINIITGMTVSLVFVSFQIHWMEKCTHKDRIMIKVNNRLSIFVNLFNRWICVWLEVFTLCVYAYDWHSKRPNMVGLCHARYLFHIELFVLIQFSTLSKCVQSYFFSLDSFSLVYLWIE